MESVRGRRVRKPIILALLTLAALSAACLAGHRDLAAFVARVIAGCRTAGPWVYFGAMAILPIFGFSLFAFVVSAGPLFAPTMGIGPVIGCGLGALAINVSLSYWLARRALRPLALRLIERLGYATPDVCRYGPWEISLLMRLLPGPPFGLQSCLLGVASIPFGIYLVTSVAVPACYFAGIVCLSSGALLHSPWLMTAAGAALLIVVAAVHRVRMRLARPWNAAGAALPGAG